MFSNLSKILNLKAIHNICPAARLHSLDVFQSVKDTKFESNSQLYKLAEYYCPDVFQSVKDTKFESNSQPCERFSVVTS